MCPKRYLKIGKLKSPSILFSSSPPLLNRLMSLNLYAPTNVTQRSRQNKQLSTLPSSHNTLTHSLICQKKKKNNRKRTSCGCRNWQMVCCGLLVCNQEKKYKISGIHVLCYRNDIHCLPSHITHISSEVNPPNCSHYCNSFGQAFHFAWFESGALCIL